MSTIVVELDADWSDQPWSWLAAMSPDRNLQRWSVGEYNYYAC